MAMASIARHERYLSTGEAAAALGGGVKAWMIRNAIQRGLLPEPIRVGSSRAIRESDLPAVREALRRGGYLPAGKQPAA